MRNLGVLAFVAAVACFTAGCSTVTSPHDIGNGVRKPGVKPGSWQVEVTYLPGASGIASSPGQLVALSPADAWVIGTIGDARIYPYADRWNGRAWSRLVLPRGAARVMAGQSSWDALTASAPGDVWLFGHTASQEVGPSHGPRDTEVWLHYDRGRIRWGVIRLPGSTLTTPSDALATGGGNVLVFGNTFVWRYRHGKWTRSRLPGRDGPIASAVAFSPGNIWALRSYGEFSSRTGGALLHYSGGHWRQISLPAAMRGALVGSVVPCGADCAWIGGGVTNGNGGTTAAIARWNGSRWHVTTPPVKATHRKRYFLQILADGRRGLWAYSYTQSRKTPLWHFGSNGWTEPAFATKALLTGPPMALIPGSASFWSTALIPGKKRGQLRVGLALIKARNRFQSCLRESQRGKKPPALKSGGGRRGARV
jgi:hypothetical protein